MADATPSVHGTPNPSPHVHGIKGFMTTTTAGMPNWVWLIVIGGGAAAAYFIPKFLNKPASPSSTTGANTSGLGLAVDPTTGLPYAVEGLVPAGGTTGNSDPNGPPIPVPQPPPTPFVWPSALSGMKIWQGTQTHLLWYGPYGPITGRLAQEQLQPLFPQGTTFREDGSKLFYTVPGMTEQTAPITLADPNPQPPKAGENLKWPGQ